VAYEADQDETLAEWDPIPLENITDGHYTAHSSIIVRVMCYKGGTPRVSIERTSTRGKGWHTGNLGRLSADQAIAVAATLSAAGEWIKENTE